MIRPFRVGDIFLVQRLAGQATKLNAAQALLFPSSPTLNALSAVIPWGGAKTSTFILHQQGHQLVRAGFIQVQRRAGWPEADIVLLAPALDTPSGHPAIWEKLLAHYIQEAAGAKLERIYCDVADQPLPVNTLKHVGFTLYSRETIWRLRRDNVYQAPPVTSASVVVRLVRPEDAWAVSQLYARITPRDVQRAEGMRPDNHENATLLQPRRAGMYHTLVLEEQNEITGCLLIQAGRRGVWFQLCADTLKPDREPLRLLLHHALAVVREAGLRLPAYIGISEYLGGMSTILMEYGFAPFTDRAKLVKYMVQWIREPAPATVPAMEPVTEAVPTHFALQESRPMVDLQRSRLAVQEPAVPKES